MAAKKQAPAQIESPEVDAESYTVVTAQNLLRHYRISLSETEVRDLIAEQQSVYRRLIRAPAYEVYNKLLQSHCQELKDHCQDLMLNLIFSKIPNESDKPREADQSYEKLRQEFARLDEHLTTLNQQQAEQSEALEQTTSESFANWHQAVTNFVKHVSDLLETNGYDVPKRFSQTLTTNLLKQGAGLEIDQSTLTSLNINTPPGPLETALIASLNEATEYE